MKLSLGIALLALLLFSGGCSKTPTSENGQPAVQGQAGQPAPAAGNGPQDQIDASSAQAADTTTVAPPALPVYDQPDIPGPGYIWTPGYWAWSSDDGDYYWVPGTWVQPPETGVLWTPGYWGWGGSAFIWHRGYWGSHVGFYGGVNYGCGYTGDGYEGGRWDHGAFYYNRSVNNITNVRTITNVYDQTVVNNVTVNNISYNGGNGGLNAQPTLAQRAWGVERHIPPTADQTQHQHAATSNRELRASVNHGKPPIAATSTPGAFSGRGVIAARAAAPYEPRPQVVPPRNEPRPEEAAPRGEPHPQAPEPRNEPRPQEAPPRNEPHPQAPPRNEPHSQAVLPRNEPPPPAAPPRNEPHPQAAPPRSEPRPQAAPPRNEPHPQEAQPRSAPPPKSPPHPPEEKPKEQHEPPH